MTKKESRSISANLRTTLGVVLFNAVIEKTNVAVKSRIKTITYRHEKKLYNLRKLQQYYVNTKTKQHPNKQIMHNSSPYVLSRDGNIGFLSDGLDQHIPSSLNKTDIDGEFRQFFLGLLKDISNVPEENFINVENHINFNRPSKSFPKIKTL